MNRTQFVSLFSAVALSWGHPLRAQSLDFTSLDSTIKKEMAQLKTPGAAVAIVQGDRVVYMKGFGVANIETGEPVRPEMLFRLGSTTKMLTAAALVSMAVEGKLDLDKPLASYLSTLPPRLGRVTSNQLLSHTAGILDRAPMYGAHEEGALGTGISKWTDEWLFTDPGQIFSYSNPGYWLAGYLLEVRSGRPFSDAMETQLFRPLGMVRTTFRPLVAMTYPLAIGHRVTTEGSPAVVRPFADNAESWPAGSAFSSVEELSRFVIAFLNGGRLEGKQVLDPKVIALLSSPHTALPGQPVDTYGYGLILSYTRGVRMLEHGGSRLGYGSTIRMAPDERVGVIILTNQSGVTLSATAMKALEITLPLRPKPTSPAKATLQITADDIVRYVGVYENGDDRVEFTADSGRLFVTRDQRMSELVKRAGDRYEAATGGSYVFSVIVDGRARYVTSGSRSFSRSR
ncbi:MAG TPA: serine hydrolase domain-containing protein [Gemmatimonadaceae bacterium]|nr:serine hydrolase domain-containing protein [Gemmatimonadaceae bacterium]